MPTRTATREVPLELVDAAQKMWLAGLGVVTLAERHGGTLSLQTGAGGCGLAASLLLPLRALPTSPGFPQVETAPLKAD